MYIIIIQELVDCTAYYISSTDWNEYEQKFTLKIL